MVSLNKTFELQDKRHLSVIVNKTWPLLEKLDDIMASSTATGQFVHAPASSAAMPGAINIPNSELGVEEDDDDMDKLDTSLLLSQFTPGPAASVSTPCGVPFRSPLTYNTSISTSTPISGPSASVTSAPSTSHTSSLTTPVSVKSRSSGGSKGKRKQSALDDVESQGSSKRHSATPSSRHSAQRNVNQTAGPALISNVSGSLLRLSDAMIQSVVSTTQGAIQAAVEKINGSQGMEDQLNITERAFLTRLVSDNANKASAYLAQRQSTNRRLWIRMELGPFRHEMAEFQAAQEAMDVGDDLVKDL